MGSSHITLRRDVTKKTEIIWDNVPIGGGGVGYDRNRIFRPDTGMEAKSGSGIAGNGMLFQNSGSGKAGKGMLF